MTSCSASSHTNADPFPPEHSKLRIHSGYGLTTPSSPARMPSKSGRVHMFKTSAHASAKVFKRIIEKTPSLVCTIITTKIFYPNSFVFQQIVDDYWIMRERAKSLEITVHISILLLPLRLTVFQAVHVIFLFCLLPTETTATFDFTILLKTTPITLPTPCLFSLCRKGDKFLLRIPIQ